MRRAQAQYAIFLWLDKNIEMCYILYILAAVNTAGGYDLLPKKLRKEHLTATMRYRAPKGVLSKEVRYPLLLPVEEVRKRSSLG